MSESLVWLLPAGAVFALLTLLLVRHGLHLRRLIRWARQPLGTPVPDAAGLWGEAFAGLHRRSRIASEQRLQLHEALERFRQATEALPDGVAILDANNSIEWLNPHAEQLLYLDNARDRGAPIVNLVREPEFIDYLRSGNHASARQLKLVRRPGQSLQIQAIPFAEGRTMLLFRDVTQMDRLETMRRDFVANVSHELKTPLTVVSGFMETLEDGWQDMPAEQVKQFLSLAREQAARMQRLIEDLLTLSALETDAPPPEERIDMAALLAEVCEEACVLSAGRHEIVLINEGPSVLLGSAGEIRSAVANLASNAVRYTPSGGKIELHWQTNVDGDATLDVIDSGIGIEAQHIPRLTERFYRVDRGRSRESGGTGLGLAIVKHVLERHGGRISVESRLGSGSRFCATIPARRLAANLPA